jgi:hypothetical protein
MGGRDIRCSRLASDDAIDELAGRGAVGGVLPRAATRQVDGDDRHGEGGVAVAGSRPAHAADVGTATVRASGVMAAFIDRDADDALDPDSEPSTPCTVADDRWQCAVEPRQITVLREEVEGGTALFVVPRWDAAASVRYCVGTDAGCDAPFAEMPGRPSDVKSGCADARTICGQNCGIVGCWR